MKWIVVLVMLSAIGWMALLGYDAYRDHFAALEAAKNQADAKAISQLVDNSVNFGYRCKELAIALDQCKTMLMNAVKP